ncbi:nuclear nucleic acid-binding protein C1D [Ixodes scapularis]|uniref:Nuclear nucleic acid-binding protein C1D n=1 Tax=Ixodes scapularis TaxID=6945 RepID=B7P2K3_IXOSC|nr:nuclear nucleic acid-binding protein C1D [Ixodes scapularis]EEC00825.1 sun-cor steroid hormone receptor co-repressor, putative [Ixodes scapularis]|eukprot:XP_002402463.1 sun-cor steroid hormone receptor co-repressor, putative [Ixodes scapularis]
MAAPTRVEISAPSQFPPELKDRAQNFHSALKKVQDILKPFLVSSLDDSTNELLPLDKARLDLTILYAMNSLFWMYLSTTGEDPKQHGVRRELERIKEYMVRARQIADKAKAPKLDQGAAQRFVRNSLWQPKDKEENGAESTPAPHKRPESLTRTPRGPPEKRKRR